MFNFLPWNKKVTVTLVLHPQLAIKTDFDNFRLVKEQFYVANKYWNDFDNDQEFEEPYLVTGLRLENGKVKEIEFTKNYPGGLDYV